MDVHGLAFQRDSLFHCTLQAEATFSRYELACEKWPLPTTVQIRPEIWTNKFKKTGFFLFLTGLEHCVSLASANER